MSTIEAEWVGHAIYSFVSIKTKQNNENNAQGNSYSASHSHTNIQTNIEDVLGVDFQIMWFLSQKIRNCFLT